MKRNGSSRPSSGWNLLMSRHRESSALCRRWQNTHDEDSEHVAARAVLQEIRTSKFGIISGFGLRFSAFRICPHFMRLPKTLPINLRLTKCPKCHYTHHMSAVTVSTSKSKK